MVREHIYLVVTTRARVSDGMQGYPEVIVPSSTDCLADIERRKQRVAIH